jgi:predicted SAM-dependent methyltransferase
MKLHLGCGNKRINGFINIDILPAAAVDVISDIMDLPYESETIELIYACNVLEHFGRNNNLDFFRKTSWLDAVEYWYSLLKPGGELFISVPDFEAVCIEYLQNKEIYDIIGITLGGQKNNEDLHGMIFDFNSMSTELENIGFSCVERYEWADFEPFKQEGYDDYSASYLPHMDFENGRLMVLNIMAIK